MILGLVWGCSGDAQGPTSADVDVGEPPGADGNARLTLPDGHILELLTPSAERDAGELALVLDAGELDQVLDQTVSEAGTDAGELDQVLDAGNCEPGWLDCDDTPGCEWDACEKVVRTSLKVCDLCGGIEICRCGATWSRREDCQVDCSGRP
jgi:hypothetical protein